MSIEFVQDFANVRKALATILEKHPDRSTDITHMSLNVIQNYNTERYMKEKNRADKLEVALVCLAKGKFKNEKELVDNALIAIAKDLTRGSTLKSEALADCISK